MALLIKNEMFHHLDSFSVVSLIKLEVTKKPCTTLKGLRRPNKHLVIITLVGLLGWWTLICKNQIPCDRWFQLLKFEKIRIQSILFYEIIHIHVDMDKI